MAVEQERGCGFRKVGGLYLCGEGFHMPCDRLPYELTVCPTCGEGVKFTRGFRWLNWHEYAGQHRLCNDNPSCPVCYPEPIPYGLLWVGEEFYTPASFIAEAARMGVSKRIPAVPRNLKLGESWVLLAHPKACQTDEPAPGVFYAFKPQRVEMLIWESEATPEYLAELEKRKVTPVIIPDGDPDHDPRTPLKLKDEDRRRLVLDNLRKMFMEE